MFCVDAGKSAEPDISAQKTRHNKISADQNSRRIKTTKEPTLLFCLFGWLKNFYAYVTFIVLHFTATVWYKISSFSLRYLFFFDVANFH